MKQEATVNIVIKFNLAACKLELFLEDKVILAGVDELFAPLILCEKHMYHLSDN